MSDLAAQALDDLQYLDNFLAPGSFCYILDDEAKLLLKERTTVLEVSMNLPLIEVFELMNGVPMKAESRAGAFALAFLYKHPDYHNWVITQRQSI